MLIGAARPEAFAGTAPPAPCRAESGEQILKVAQIHLALGLVFPSLRALGMAAVVAARRAFGTALVNLAPIVARPLLWVGQQIVRSGDRFELRLRFGLARVQIR